MDHEMETQEVYPAGQVGVVVDSGTLPSGTVTFLFTDIEGSTRLLEKLREGYARVLLEQRQILREVFQRWRGHEVDTQGDSFFVAFGRATDAIACAMEAQKSLAGHSWPQGASVRVRMGLHTGEPLVAKTGYVGIDVHRAARIAAVGHGGQVLLSQTTRDLVCQDLPPETRLFDLGAHMLKDMRYPQQIYQLEIPGLPNEFPPLKSLDRLTKEEEPPAPGQSPYMGLQYFDEGDAAWFFGRQAVTNRLVDAVSTNRFLAVVGASGSGKSSVVRAGLVPATKNRYPKWQLKVITPTSHPLEALATCLTREAESVTATATLIDDMQGSLRSLHLYCQKRQSGKEARLLLVIDQFEELFTACRSEEERLAFVTNLLYAACVSDGKVSTVITLRADFYDRLAQYVGLREMVAAHQVYIGAMSAAELREAIEAPAKRGGWVFSPGLVDLILSDLGASGERQPEPGALPLLSHALLETWKRRRGNLLSLKAYTEAGGVRGAIAKTAESVFYGQLTPEQQVIAKDIFLRLTELGEGTQDTRRRISIHELIPPGPAVETEQIYTVLGVLADSRLITTGEKTVEVAHEALIREWPTLREWLAADREGLRLHRHLTEAAQEWELLERDAGALYRGARLSQALEWAMANPRSLSAMEQDFLEASRGAAEQEQAEREAQRQRELEAAQKLAETERQRAEEQGRSAQRLRRRAYLLGGVLALALILAGMAGIFGQQADTNAKLANQNLATAEGEANQRATAEVVAVQERESAQEQERLATSRYLTAAALNNLALDSQLSANLALRAYQAYPTSDAENALHTVLPELRLVKSTLIANAIYNIVSEARPVRGGQGLFVASPGGIVVYDFPTGTLSMFAEGQSCGIIRPTPDGRWLAANCPRTVAQNIQVWETETKKLLFTSPDLGMNIVGYGNYGLIPPSPTHSLLAYVCYEDLIIHVWEVSSGKELFVLSGQGLTTSQDGKLTASFSWEGLVIFWDLETGSQLLQFDAQSGGIGTAVFSPDGAHLATWGDDKTIKVWDLTSLSPGPRLEYSISHEMVLAAPQNAHILLYSPDGTRLAAGGNDGLVRVWDAQTGKLQLALSGHEGMSVALAFSQDGKRLYSASNDWTIKEWDVTPGRELLTLPGRIGGAPFSPDGTKLALTAADGSVSIVDSQTGEVLRQWQAYPDEISDIAWSPDGARLATSNGFAWWSSEESKEYAVKIWDPSTGQLLKEIPGDENNKGFPQLAWSPDSSRLVTNSGGTGDIFIWDTASGNLLQTLPTLYTETWDVAYSPDGQKIAASCASHSQDILVWDAATGKQVFTWPPGHSAFELAFSPDGQRLATSQTEGSILLFKLRDIGGDLERTLAGGTQALRTTAFSPDGALLATGDATGKVRVWDLKTMQLRLELAIFTDPVFRLAFSPDSRRLVASSMSGTTYFYLLPTDEVIQLVRSRILRPMKPAECQQYLHKQVCPLSP